MEMGSAPAVPGRGPDRRGEVVDLVLDHPRKLVNDLA
jgi:hypothetical protein